MDALAAAWLRDRGGRRGRGVETLPRSRWNWVGAAVPAMGRPHLSPGYGAGYDAGFQAGLLAASQGRASPPPPAAEGGAGASAPEPARPPMLTLLEDFPDLFQKEVLERLDRGLLGRTGSAVRTAAKRSGLPRVGGSAEEPRVGIVPFCQSLSTFVWAVANGCPWQRAATCATLARGGHLEVLQWAREHGCPWDVRTMQSAAAGGHLELLRWAREHGCPWEEDLEDEDFDSCRAAAEGGHLEVLRWLREQDCPWDETTCSNAALGGHLEVLKWAREHGCPWNKVTCEFN